MQIERLIIVLNQDGSFRDASAQNFEGLPAPIPLAAIQQLGIGAVAEISQAKASVEELKVYHANELETLKEEINTLKESASKLSGTLVTHQKESEGLAAAAESVLATATMDDASRGALEQIVVVAKSFGVAREKLRLQAEAQKRQQEADELFQQAQALTS